MPDITPYFYKWNYDFWNEVYEGEKNSKNERSGLGEVTWSLDDHGFWRFEQWANEQSWSNDEKEYDYDDKLNPDRKLTDNKIKFKGEWKNNYPYGNGKFYLNDELFFDGNLLDGYIHGRAKFKMNFITLVFGIYNNYLKVPGYSDIQDKEEYNQKMKANENFGEFEGEFKDGLADGHGNLILNSGLSYKGSWSKGYPHGSGVKTYVDGRQERGEFGILNENTLKLQTEYVEDENGNFLNGTRTFADGSTENVDERTLIQKAKTFF
ncbi:hypothetical protein [Candidatus Pelagibacter sp.]|uniref:hypothetical protein n=1 Tax=Candidatus Pelagibacter sp. TaxID=2024849 RepID=UPI003F8382CF